MIFGRYSAYRWPWRALRRPEFARCGEPGKDHGGVRNPCLRSYGHGGLHKDMWGDKWLGLIAIPPLTTGMYGGMPETGLRDPSGGERGSEGNTGA